MLGADFEGFLVHDGGPVPAEMFLEGTKKKPFKVADNVVVHPDNVMAEAAILSPVEHKHFQEALEDALNELIKAVSPAEFVAESTMLFSEEWLDAARLSKVVGCDPDFDSDGGTFQYSPRVLGNYRYAGFHIHFDVPNDVPAAYAAKVIDCTVGVASVAMEWDTGQGRRREFYGTPGRHRPKSYGIEYRTLGSGVLNHIKEAAPIIVGVADRLASTDNDTMLLPHTLWDTARIAISTEDTSLARMVWKEVQDCCGL